MDFMDPHGNRRNPQPTGDTRIIDLLPQSSSEFLTSTGRRIAMLCRKRNTIRHLDEAHHRRQRHTPTIHRTGIRRHLQRHLFTRTHNKTRLDNDRRRTLRHVPVLHGPPDRRQLHRKYMCRLRGHLFRLLHHLHAQTKKRIPHRLSPPRKYHHRRRSPAIYVPLRPSRNKLPPPDPIRNPPAGPLTRTILKSDKTNPSIPVRNDLNDRTNTKPNMGFHLPRRNPKQIRHHRRHNSTNHNNNPHHKKI